MKPLTRALAVLTAIAASAVAAPAAMASIGTPGLTLTPGAGTAASTANLGTDITFSPAGGDSVKNMTLKLPSGLLASAAIDGGACLKSAAPLPACQIGSGKITASVIGSLFTLPALNARFTLVAPPAPGDLAGLDVSVQDPVTQQYGVLGSPAAVTVRQPSDPAGFGLNIAFSNIPNTYAEAGILPLSISVNEINATFNAMRFPSTCPSTPARFSVSASSYNDATTRTTSAPLRVTGCGSAPYAPRFSATVRQDASDRQVTLTSTITQAANQAPNGSVSLAFPTSTLSPNLAAIGALCRNLSSSCQTVGSATAKSSVYPTALSGKAYLTGDPRGLALTLVFPAPFSLTLTGRVDIGHNTASFQGLPDIPLTSLGVTLNGGPKGLFRSNCRTPSGTATAALTSQNGDQHRTVASRFTVADCHVKGIAVHGPGSGGPGGGGSGPTNPTAPPKVTTTSATGLSTGKPSLTFRIAEGRKAPKLDRLTVALPKGLSFTRHRVELKAKGTHKARSVLKVTGVSLKGAKLKSLSLSHGHLVIALRHPVRALTVRLGSSSLHESAAMRAKAASGKLKSVTLKVTVRNVKHKNRTLTVTVKPRHR